jgi:hypothetical protein
MRRRLALSLTLTSLLAACGGGSDSAKSTPVSGTIGGQAFTPADVRAVLADSGTGTCDLSFPGAGTISVMVSGLLVDFTSWTDVCADYQKAACQLHQGGRNVTVLLARLIPAGLAASAPPLEAKTYTVKSSFTDPDVTPYGTGGLQYIVAYAGSLAQPAAACTATPSNAVTGGKVTLTSVSAAGVKGSVSLTFADGGALAGDFDAPACPGFSPNICTLAQTQSLCGSPPACVP